MEVYVPMISYSEIQLMKDAYGKFYEIENIIRKIVIKKMKESYGLFWEPKMNFKKISYHELLSNITNNPILSSLFSSNINTRLYSLIPIRNKIAHSQVLSEHELGKLNYVYVYFKEKWCI